MKSESSLETRFAELLDELHIKYIQQFPLLHYRYDFYLPEYNLLVELQGNYWHGKSGVINSVQKKNKANDVVKMEVARNKGFKLKTFWEEQVLFDPESVVEELSFFFD